jgi:hypothetical protein
VGCRRPVSARQIVVVSRLWGSHDNCRTDRYRRGRLIALVGWLRWVEFAGSHDGEMRNQRPLTHQNTNVRRTGKTPNHQRSRTAARQGHRAKPPRMGIPTDPVLVISPVPLPTTSPGPNTAETQPQQPAPREPTQKSD